MLRLRSSIRARRCCSCILASGAGLALWLAGCASQPPPNAPPTLTHIANQVTASGAELAIPLTIADETLDSLVFGFSTTDPTLVAADAIRLSGTGSTPTLHVTPSPVGAGTVQIGVDLTDAHGLAAATSFDFEIHRPFTHELQRLTASNAKQVDYFGNALAVDGGWLIVGAWGASSETGAAYIFELQGDTWVEVDILTASDGATGDQFGAAVAIHGDYAIVAAEGDDDAGQQSGSAYVFQRQGDDWVEVDKLTVLDAAAGDQFGRSVALHEDLAIVGASSAADGGQASGSAYVFQRQGDDWVEMDELTASDAAALAYFGTAVAIRDDVALVGATGDGEAGVMAGAVYVFERNGDAWTEVDKLDMSDVGEGDVFGNTIAQGDGVAVVGAIYGRAATGSSTGAAYAYRRASNGWVETDKLLASAASVSAHFGARVALLGSYALVSATGQTTGTTGSGVAYVFRRSGDVWTEVAMLTPDERSDYDAFGAPVAIDVEHAFVGSAGDDNGRGAVIVFRKIPLSTAP